MAKREQEELSKEFYETMYLMRRFEQEVFEFYKRGLMPGLAHLYLGEEAVAAGACKAILASDYICSTHRGHGHLVARGADINRMMAEILGKETGYSRGKGGSMHIIAMDKGILGSNGIVGGGIPMATGAAYSARVRKSGQVILCFFGDGASNQGTFHESINMAAAWDLPIVYIIENNSYGITVDIKRITKEHQLAKRAVGYGIDGYTIDGNDVFTVYETVNKAVDKARSGCGPSIVECLTYRWQGHNVGDPGAYRDPQEVADWKAKEPLILLKNKKLLTEDDIRNIKEKVEKDIQAAKQFAVDSPYPPAEDAFRDVFSV